jgi:hypothetical protein
MSEAEPNKLMNDDFENKARRNRKAFNDASVRLDRIEAGLEALGQRLVHKEEDQSFRKTIGIRKRYALVKMRTFTVPLSIFKHHLNSLFQDLWEWLPKIDEKYERLDARARSRHLGMVADLGKSVRKEQGDLELFLADGKKLGKVLNSIEALRKCKEIYNRLVEVEEESEPDTSDAAGDETEDSGE